MATFSATTIANTALRHLGETRVESIDEASKNGRLLRDAYDDVRQAVLRTYTWNFAKAQAELAADPVAPLFDYAFAYELPADQLRLIKVNDSDFNDGVSAGRWELYGRKIVTNLIAPLQIVYISDVENAVLMDPLFREAFALRLALELAEAITGTTTQVETVAALYKRSLDTARSADGQEPSNGQIIASEWEIARLGGAGRVFVRGDPNGVPL